MLHISPLLAANPGFIVIVIIVLVMVVAIPVFAISYARKKKEPVSQSSFDPNKIIPMSPEVQGMYVLAKRMVFNGELDRAIIVCERMYALEPDSLLVNMLLGNLIFEKHPELSFQCLKRMERYLQEEGVRVDDPGVKDWAMYFYMLGFHYNRHYATDKAITLQNAAMNSRDFVKRHKAFRERFPYRTLNNDLNLTEDQLFDGVFASEGGAFSLKENPIQILKEKVQVLKGHFDDLYDYLKKSHERLPKIHFDFIDTMQLNAYATKSGDQHLIGLNLGTYLILEDMFDKMMASSNVLPDIGNITQETAEKKLLNVIETGGALSFALPKWIHPRCVSGDPIRRQLADFYKIAAFDFIVLHEFAHLAGGHVGYLQSLHKPVYAELQLSGRSAEKIDFSLYQAMEKEADMVATIRSFLMAAQFLELYKSKPQALPVYKDWESFIYHWTFAIYSSFRLFGFKQYKASEAKASTHPPPSVRMALISMSVVGLFTGKTFTKIDNNMSVIMFEAAMAAEEALQSISFFPNTTGIYQNNWESEEIKKYIFDITDKAYELMPVFKPFSFF